MNKNRLFPLAIFLSFLFFFSFGKNYSKVGAQDPFVVVLDAGHGGHDPGNLGNGYLEKNIALKIVLQTGKILEQNSDIEVVYTRKDDSFVDLFVRGEIANKANADLFVSIHCDSHSTDAHGAGTFVLGLHANEQNFEIAKKENSVIYLEDNYATRYADYDINSPESVIGLTIMQEEFLDQSIALAKVIQDRFSNKLKRKDRKVKQAGFIVLHQTFMPSVLVETGFLTNDEDGAYLNSTVGQSEMGTAIAEAISNYKMNSSSDTGQDMVSTMPNAPDPENAIDPANEGAIDNNVGETNSVVGQAGKDIPEVVSEPSVSNNEKVAAMLEQAEKTAIESITKSEEAETPDKADTASVAHELPKQETEVVVTEVNEPGRPKIVKEEVKSIETSTAESEPSIKDDDKVIVEGKVIAPTPKAIEAEAKPTANIEFRVQLMASAKNLAADHRIFKGLSPIIKEPYKNLFRYMHGRTGKYVEALLMKKEVDAKGFNTSFLVAYKDGVRIDVREARKYVLE
jgi:N-acetylmuramoyl-L-alanine amidase